MCGPSSVSSILPTETKWYLTEKLNWASPTVTVTATEGPKGCWEPRNIDYNSESPICSISTSPTFWTVQFCLVSKPYLFCGVKYQKMVFCLAPRAASGAYLGVGYPKQKKSVGYVIKNQKNGPVWAYDTSATPLYKSLILWYNQSRRLRLGFQGVGESCRL